VIQGGIAKAYGDERLYKVQAVAVIPSLKRVLSEEKHHQPKRDTSDSSSKRNFTKVLEDACEKEQQRNIHICVNGYTRDARPFYHLVNMREYCQ